MSINAVHIEKQMERLVGSGLNNIPPTLTSIRSRFIDIIDYIGASLRILL